MISELDRKLMNMRSTRREELILIDRSDLLELEVQSYHWSSSPSEGVEVKKESILVARPSAVWMSSVSS